MGPPAEADKAKAEETPAKEEKTETAVVNGDAKVQEDGKKADTANESAPATTEKQPQENFFTKMKKHMSFKNINMLKKKKAPTKETTDEKKDQETAPAKVEETKKEGEAESDKKVESTPEKSDDKKEVKEDQSAKAPE